MVTAGMQGSPGWDAPPATGTDIASDSPHQPTILLGPSGPKNHQLPKAASLCRVQRHPPHFTDEAQGFLLGKGHHATFFILM